jgi:hypothetical protein
MRYGQGGQSAGWHGPTASARFDSWPERIAGDPAPVVEELTRVSVRSVGRPIDRRVGLVIGLIAAVLGFGFMNHDERPGTRHGGDDDVALVSASTAADPTAAIEADEPAALVDGSYVPAPATALAISVVVDDEGASWLTVDGSDIGARVVLEIAARTATGEVVADGSVAVVADDERPASDGGQRVSGGSVHARIALPGDISPKAFGVTVHWRDARIVVP